VPGLFKLSLAIVLSAALTAPPALAQDGGYGWSFGVGVTLAIAVVVVVVGAYLGYGFSFLILDAPFGLAEETVDINLSADRVTVSATYVFRNDGDEEKTLELAYPFGEGRGVGPAENVALSDGLGNEIPFTWKGDRIAFDVSVPRKNYAQVFVSYEQPLDGTAFTYLLGKDRFWNLPGADTSFVVTAPAALGRVSSVYSIKKVAEEGGVVRYEYSRKRFYPQNNFNLTWENAAAAP
jgi:hypothetical protein